MRNFASTTPRVLLYEFRDNVQYIITSFVQFYSLAVVRINDLCTRLRLTDDELKRKIWTCLEYSIMHQTQLMKDRHLDQILMCAVYVICRVSISAFYILFFTFAFLPYSQSFWVWCSEQCVFKHSFHWRLAQCVFFFYSTCFVILFLGIKQSYKSSRENVCRNHALLQTTTPSGQSCIQIRSYQARRRRE